MRLDWIDALKGFGIFAVVFGHCVSDCLSSNSYQTFNSLLVILSDFFTHYRMPLFFTISGYLFYLSKSYTKYRQKVLDCFLIYLFWSMLIWLLKYIASSQVNNPVVLFDLIAILWKPILVYWYLYVLIIYYLVFSILRIHKLTAFHLILLGTISYLVKYYNPNIGILQNTLFYCFFFALGGYLYINKIQIKSKLSITLILLCSLNCCLYFTTYNNMPRELYILKTFLLSSAAIIPSFYLFQKYHWLNSSLFLKLLGRYSLEIYLIHCFVTAGLRIVYRYLDIKNFYLYFTSALILGILVPIVIGKISKKHPLLAIPFNPTNSLKKLFS